MDVHQRAETVCDTIDATSPAFLRRVAELVPGIVYVFNHKTQCNEYSNRSIAELLGYTPNEAAEMGDVEMKRVVHEADLPGLKKYFESMVDQSDGAWSSFEYRCYAKDGAVVWLKSNDMVFGRAPDGTVLRHVGIAFDITEEKEAAKHREDPDLDLEARVKVRTQDLETIVQELGLCLAEQNAVLQDMNRDLKDLTYVATHDLKVPIKNINSLIYMLEDAEALLPPEHVETLGWLRDASQQACDKLDALVCVAQAHSDNLPPFEMVDLNAVAEHALVNLHFQVNSVRAVVQTDFSQPTVWFVQREMEHILQSMIGNALRYSDSARRPRITLKSQQMAGHVDITITDNGTGLNLPRDAEKVFGLFKRAHTIPDGAGVSLYSIRRMIERIGGRISVSGEKGRGCCFTITLPNRSDPA